MKRFLAYLCALVVTVLPLASFAEGIPFNALDLQIIAEADTESFAAFLTEVLGTEDDGDDATRSPFPSDSIHSLSEGLARMLDGADALLHVQDGANSLSLSLAKQSILQLRTYTLPDDAQTLAIETDVLPNVILTMEADEDGANGSFDLSSIDWDDAIAALPALVNEWLDHSESALLEGSFRGDAYNGAVRLQRYHLNERDLFALAEVAFLRFPALHEADELFHLTESLREAALRNRYRYDLSLAYSEDGTLVGCSLTVTEQTTTVMTLSLGFPAEDQYRLVIGLGLENAPTYVDCALQVEIKNLSYPGGSARMELSLHEYTDPYGEGFAAVSQNSKRAEGTIHYTVHVSHDATGDSYSGTEQYQISAGRLNLICANKFDASTAPLHVTETMTFSGEDGEAPFLTLRCETSEGEVLSFSPSESATQVDLIDFALDENSVSLLDKAAQTLMWRLFRVIPAELIVYFME